MCSTLQSSAEIRAASRSDTKEIRALEKVCSSNPWTDAFFDDEFAYEPSLHFIAEIGVSGIIGFLFSRVVYDEWHVHNIAVHPSWRRKGFAAQLLTTAMLKAPSLGAARGYLEVRSGNEGALSLYYRLGFNLEYRRKAYYPDGEDGLIFMKQFLAPAPISKS